MLVWDALCALNLENFYFFMPSTESIRYLLRGDLCELDLQNLFVDLHALRNHMFCRQVFFDLFFIHYGEGCALHQIVVERLVPGVDFCIWITGSLLLQLRKLDDIFFAFGEKAVNQIFLELLEL